MSKLEKLKCVQANIKAPKSQYNSFGGYYYRSCEDILGALKPLLEEYNCTVVVSDEVKQVGDRYYIEATARFIDCESGEEVQVKALAREAFEKKKMDDAQVTGSSSSYARKYALNGLLCLDDVKDDDAGEGKDSEKASKAEPKAENKGDEKEPKVIEFWQKVYKLGYKRDEAMKAISQAIKKDVKNLEGYKADTLKKLYNILKSRNEVLEKAEELNLSYEETMELASAIEGENIKDFSGWGVSKFNALLKKLQE